MRHNNIIWLLALFLTAQTIQAQTVALTGNGDGTWTLAKMPAYNVKLLVDYENLPKYTYYLNDNGDGTWSLAEMPWHDVKLEVEYEDLPKKTHNLTDNGDGTWSLTEMPWHDVKLEVEYIDLPKDSYYFTDNGDGTWSLDEMPWYDVRLDVEYDVNDIILADNDDNTEVLVDNLYRTANVTLQGRTFRKDGNWSTLSLPFYLDDFTGTPLEGATVRELETWGEQHDGHSSGIEDHTIYLFFKKAGSIEPGIPYIVKWDEGEDITDPVFENVDIIYATGEMMFTPDYMMRGIFSPVYLAGGDMTKLYLGQDNALHWPEADMTIGAFRAYFDVIDEYTAQTLEFYYIDYGDGDIATGITKPGTDAPDSGTWYTTDGQRLSAKPTRPGVYIQNARKVVVH